MRECWRFTDDQGDIFLSVRTDGPIYQEDEKLWAYWADKWWHNEDPDQFLLTFSLAWRTINE